MTRDENTFMNKRFEKQTIRLGDMFCDHDEPLIQRPFQRNNGMKILRDFTYEEFLFQPILLSAREGGRYHTMQGQHKVWAAARKLGEDFEVEDCYVFTDLIRPEEAEIFRSTRHTRAIKGIDDFLASVTEGDQTSIRISEIVTRSGWKIGAHGIGRVACVKTLIRLYNKNATPEGTCSELKGALSIIGSAWNYTESPQGALLIGLVHFMIKYRDRLNRTIWNELPGRLAAADIKNLISDIKRRPDDPSYPIAKISDRGRRTNRVREKEEEI